PRWLETSGTFPLGVVSFGAPMPLSLSCPVVELALPLLEGPSRCELWSCDQPVRLHRDREISAAFTDDVLFGSITAPDNADAGLDHTTEKAYRQVAWLARGFWVPSLLR